MSGLRVRDSGLAAFAVRNLQEQASHVTATGAKLSSGRRINTAADDAAGFMISERMRARIGGLERARSNTQDGISLLQVADGAMSQMADILQRMRVLSVQAASDTLTSADRETIQVEMQEHIREINRQSQTANFNDKNLLGGVSNVASQSSSWTGLGSPWQVLQDAVTQLSGGDQAVTFTYSFMIAGAGTDNGNTSALQDAVDGSVNGAQFQAEVTAAFAEWKSLFETVFSTSNGYGGNLTVNFTNLGDETGNTEPSGGAGGYALPHAENIGDFRVGMHAIDGGLSILAHGYSPGGTPGSIGSVGGDTHFDVAEDWRADATAPGADPGAFSVMMVAAHEIGHNFGLGHDSNSASLMYAFASPLDSFSSKFAGGLAASTVDQAAVAGIYDTSAKDPFKIHVGADEDETVTLSMPTVNASSLGVAGIDVETREGAESALDSIATALDRLSVWRADLGAAENRLQSTHAFTGQSNEGMANARSRVSDADFARESSDLALRQVKLQAAVAALGQANISRNAALQLIGMST